MVSIWKSGRGEKENKRGIGGLSSEVLTFALNAVHPSFSVPLSCSCPYAAHTHIKSQLLTNNSLYFVVFFSADCQVWVSTKTEFHLPFYQKVCSSRCTKQDSDNFNHATLCLDYLFAFPLCGMLLFRRDTTEADKFTLVQAAKQEKIALCCPDFPFMKSIKYQSASIPKKEKATCSTAVS